MTKKALREMARVTMQFWFYLTAAVVLAKLVYLWVHFMWVWFP
jgi:hypothetical protein